MRLRGDPQVARHAWGAGPELSLDRWVLLVTLLGCTPARDGSRPDVVAAGGSAHDTGPLGGSGGSVEGAAPSPFGVFNDLTWDGDRFDGTEALALGHGRARTMLWWWFVEPRDGEWDWTLTDHIVDLHDQAGIALIASLKCASPWATRNTEAPSMSSPPLDMARYERFVREVVTRYRDRVALWQIENEVGDASRWPALFWDGTMEEYVELLRTAYRVIKEVDPDATVVLQGYGGFMLEDLDNNIPGARELLDYFMAEAQDAFDVVDVHQYLKPDLILTVVPVLRDAMRRNGYEKPIISTEAGDLDLGLFARHLGDPAHPIPIIAELLQIPALVAKLRQLQVGGISQQDLVEAAFFLEEDDDARPILERYQAESLVKRYALSFGAGVHQVYWVSIRDHERSTTPDWYHAMMGLVAADGRRKPHWYTYRRLMAALEGFTAAAIVEEGPDTYVVRFERPAGPTWVVWGAGGRVDLSAEIGGPEARVRHIVTRLEANRAPIELPDELLDATTLTATATPVFISRP